MIKWNCEEPELEAHRYVAANTTIPIPRLHKVHHRNGKLALEIEFLPDCDILQSCWRNFTDQQKRAAVDEISG